MAPGDLPIWRRYQPTHQAEWISVYYDAALGDPAPVDTHSPPTNVDMWQRITRLRADAIIRTRKGWTIIEVRPSAGPAALGALATYRSAWRKDPPDNQPVSALLVTDQTTPTVTTAADELQIQIIIA